MCQGKPGKPAQSLRKMASSMWVRRSKCSWWVAYAAGIGPYSSPWMIEEAVNRKASLHMHAEMTHAFCWCFSEQASTSDLDIGSETRLDRKPFTAADLAHRWMPVIWNLITCGSGSRERWWWRCDALRLRRCLETGMMRTVSSRSRQAYTSQSNSSTDDRTGNTLDNNSSICIHWNWIVEDGLSDTKTMIS